MTSEAALQEETRSCAQEVEWSAPAEREAYKVLVCVRESDWVSHCSPLDDNSIRFDCLSSRFSSLLLPIALQFLKLAAFEERRREEIPLQFRSPARLLLVRVVRQVAWMRDRRACERKHAKPLSKQQAVSVARWAFGILARGVGRNYCTHYVATARYSVHSVHCGTEEITGASNTRSRKSILICGEERGTLP